MRKIFIAVCLLLTIQAQSQDFERIRVTGMNRNILIDPATGMPSGYIEVRSIFRLQLPEALAQLPNVTIIAESYRSMFNIDHIDTIDAVLYAVFIPAPINLNIWKVVNGVTTQDLITDADIKAALQQEYNIYSARLVTFQVLPFDAILGKSLIGNTWEESE